MRDQVDVMIKVDKQPEGLHINFITEKTRDAEDRKWGAVANFGDWTFNLSPASYCGGAERLTGLDTDILKIAEGHVTGVFVVDMIEELKATGQYTQAKIRNRVNGLRDRGLLERLDGGGRGTKAAVGLTARGIELLS